MKTLRLVQRIVKLIRLAEKWQMLEITEIGRQDKISFLMKDESPHLQMY